MKLGIVVGGGPAPGINGVIGAAAIEANKNGIEALGFTDGFSHLAGKSFDPDRHIQTLKLQEVGRIHLEGGSILRTARTSLLNTDRLDQSTVVEPDTTKVSVVCQRLLDLDVSLLLTIGGDDTALSARFVAEHSKGRIRVAHVPKTIDNDLPLQGDMPTFGYTSARSEGSELVVNLMEDARTTNRWYIVQTMGRNSGFLALGIGKAAGATVTIIPEEVQNSTTIGDLATLIEGTILKRRTMDRKHGVIVIAEGLAYKLGDIDELSRLLGRTVPVDAAGHPRLSEVPLAELLKNEVTRRFAQRGESVAPVAHTLGYELRCARPGSFDLSYCRDLGHGGVRLLLNDAADVPNGVMVTIQQGELVPLPFEAMVDPRTHRTRIRKVDINSYSYQVARAYMIRLETADFKSPSKLKALAREAHMTPDEFRNKFEPVITQKTVAMSTEIAGTA